MKIGAQLYTVREYCKNLDDLSLTLKKIADIGYRYVQVSGVCEYDSNWLKKELDKNGLKCVITHTPKSELLGNINKVINDHNALECDYVGLGHFAFNDEKPDTSFEYFFNTYPAVIKAIKNGGKYFMYHNHAHEFKKVDGKLIIDHIADTFSPDELGFTLDTYWVQMGGGDPAYFIEKYNGRVPCIHLKDYAYGGVMSVVGEGNINFDRVFEKAESSGTKYMLVEQDNCNGEDPFECLKRSFDNLKAFGF